MKRIIINVFVIAPWLICIMLPINVNASTCQQEVSIAFVDNPNLPRAPAPGVSPRENPKKIANVGLQLPKTNDSGSSLSHLGFSILFSTITIFILDKLKQIKILNDFYIKL